MNNKRRILKIVFIIFLCYLIFAGIVISFYYRIRYDPEDGAATAFLHESTSLQNEIGEVRYVGKMAFRREIEDADGLHIVYSVETYEARYHIQVHFRESEKEWIPHDYTILKLDEEF